MSFSLYLLSVHFALFDAKSYAQRTFLTSLLVFVTPNRNLNFFLQQVSKQTQMTASLWLQPWNYSSASLLWSASTDVCCAFVGGRVGVLMRTVRDLAVFYHCHYDCCLLWMQIARHWLWLLVEMWRWPLQFLLDYISIVCCSHGTFKKGPEGDDSLI